MISRKRVNLLERWQADISSYWCGTCAKQEWVISVFITRNIKWKVV